MFGNLKNPYCLVLFLCLVMLGTSDALGQDKKPPKSPAPTGEKLPPMPGAEPPGVFDDEDRVTSERSMMVDPNVAIKLCVSEGDLKINGWRRDEVRVFVKEGRRFGMKPQEKSVESGKVNWLWLTNMAGRVPRQASE